MATSRQSSECAEVAETLVSDQAFNLQRDTYVKRATAFLILALSYLCQFATATEYQHEKFSLDIPQDWVIVPIDVLNQRLKEQSWPEGIFQLSLAPSAKLPTFFDADAVDRLPTVHIQDIPEGYLDGPECRKTLEDAETMNAGFSSGEYGPLMRSRIVTFLVTGTEGPLIGQDFEIILKIVCTMSGTIIVHTNNKADEETYKSDIKHILGSFSVADRYQWKQQDSNSDRIVKAGKRGLQSALGWGFVGSIFSLIVYFSLRRKKRSKDSF